MKYGWLLALLALVGCVRGGPPATLHYVVGRPYQAGGVWFYPHEDFARDETGLATVYAGGHAAATADGERFDQSALAAGHPTLQLPALARLTNLENGRQILVRINDRGPADPARMMVITRRAALLLAVADPRAVRMRLQVLPDESRQMAASLHADGPALKVAAAPEAGVTTESLAPPPGTHQGAGAAPPAAIAVAAPRAGPAIAAVPLRLPEAVTQGPARPGQLEIDCGDFSQPAYADVLRARLAALGARATTSYDAPRDRAYMVRIGPLANVAAADAMLQR
ncbi:MAG: SPOR domain-containing protein, partial [Rhodospirillales bacterium]|nr:SPOR domain-containing protein [Rhodospirillales bacterium]